MKVLVTGHAGYIGSVLIPMLLAAKQEVTGLDTDFFAGCDFHREPAGVPALRKDLRDVTVADLKGFDAVIHLAALSNDPLGDLNPDCTYGINHRASVRLGELAKAAGVPRFIFSSSCSLYGLSAGDGLLDEGAAFNPVTAYGESKVRVEQEVSPLADDSFSPTFLRNATAYGVSPRLRADLVVNNLVGYAYTTGEVLIASDGTPWRPLVHVEDIARAFIAVLQAPRERIHNQAFNVGRTGENYQIRDVAAMVEEVVPGCRVKYAEGGGPDLRCYRVNCDKIARTLPEFQPRWTVRRGIEQLYTAFRDHGLTVEEFTGSRYIRIKHISSLLATGRLDAALRWSPQGSLRSQASARS
jgi:nucleoside-diphosphate-sugar epimerase